MVRYTDGKKLQKALILSLPSAYNFLSSPVAGPLSKVLLCEVAVLSESVLPRGL